MGRITNPARKSRREYENRVRNERRVRVYEIMGNTCAHCNKDYPPVCLDLHHVDPAEKDHTVSQILRYKWERILAELKKCVVLCANCHRLEHERLNEEEKKEQAINDKFQISLL